MHERQNGPLAQEAPRPLANPERERYLQFCRDDESRADDDQVRQNEFDLLLEKWGYMTPECVPSEKIGISVEGGGVPDEDSYFVRVVWHWPAGRIVHEYLFRRHRGRGEVHKQVNWIYGNGQDSLPERTVGSHSLPYVSSGELDYLSDLLERSYEGYVACSKGPRPSPHPNRRVRSISG